MNKTKTREHYDNRRRIAMALLRQLGTVKRVESIEYIVSVPKAILKIPALRRQVRKALRTLNGKITMK
jgi:hypothetical protein